MTEARLKYAMQIAAQVVVDHGEAYLPLFERMEKELSEHQSKNALMERARKIAEGNRTRGPKKA